jgi:hypothetical protein
MAIHLYGLGWNDMDDAAMVEMEIIRAGGYMDMGGQRFGHGLFYHYKALQQLLWPEGEDHHRWSDLALQEIIENRVTVMAGSKDSGKTHVASRFVITDYFVFPHDTLALVSSTEGRGAELRVYGDLKDLHRRAQELRPWLPGQVGESLKVIATDVLSKTQKTRDLRKGIAWIPIPKGDDDYLGGLRTFIGVKQKRRRLMGDELQFCPTGYMDVLANLDKGDFKGLFMGNFIGKGDPLDRMAEPECGWASQPEPKKTTVWNNRLGGRTINFVGTDSPNFDPPLLAVPRYPYLIDQGDIERVKKRYGENSLQFYSQIKGVRKPDIMARRVLTMDIARNCGAFETCIWSGSPRTRVYALDCAFGGDRAVGGMVEFGTEVKGATVIKVHPFREIPIDVTSSVTPEEQLARATKNDCDLHGISDANVFFDAGMRAMVGVHMANIVGRGVNAINFGGPATPRPVSATDFVYDEKQRQRRPKRCDEAYVKFVTELAFAVRLVVESRQVREIPEAVVREFEMREWCDAPGDKVELETKQETKKRMGQSPDLADWLEIAVEGCRRLGFQIEGLQGVDGSAQEDQDYLRRELEKFRTFQKTSELDYRA